MRGRRSPGETGKSVAIDETRKIRRRRYFSGIAAEWVAAAWLTMKGYRIIGMRVRTPAGEIDLIALNHNMLVFIEVKRRATLEEAQASVGIKQRSRIRSAAQLWLASKQQLQARDIRFDLVFLIGWKTPVHIIDGL